MPHPVIDDLTARHTTKQYDPTRKLSDEDLNTFLTALRLTPSSINSQPWKFIVLESDEAKARMVESFEGRFAKNIPHVYEASQFILFAHHTRYSRDDYEKVLEQFIADGRFTPEDKEMQAALFVFVEMNSDDDGNNQHWTRAQTYIALGNALHTAARMNIHATPIEGINAPRVNELFAKELGEYRCDVALAIGYGHPDDLNARLPKSRLSAEDVIVKL